MTKIIISKFREKPKTRTAWWAMGLGLSVFLMGPMLGIFAAVIRPLIDEATNETVGAAIGFLFGIGALVLSIAALVTGIRAYRKGERSWVMWVGFVPSIMVALFWVFLLVGEFAVPH